jgi:DNA-binding HxlR family transcriptional regulator
MSPRRQPVQTGELFVRWPGSRTVLTLLADKWTIPVIHALAQGTKRTGQLRRELSGVSQKMLTQTLRALERHGFIAREVHPVVPPRVEYRLTPLGRSLNGPLAQLCAWVAEHGAELKELEH